MRGRRYDAYWLRKKHGRGKFWDGLDPQELYTGPITCRLTGSRSDGGDERLARPARRPVDRSCAAGNPPSCASGCCGRSRSSRITGPTCLLRRHGPAARQTGLEAAAHYYNRRRAAGRGRCRAVRQEAGGRRSAARSSRMSSAASSTRSGPSRGRPTPASATGTTTGGSTRTTATRAPSRWSSGSPTSCRRTAICCSTSRCAATARSTRRKRRSSTRSRRGRSAMARRSSALGRGGVRRRPDQAAAAGMLNEGQPTVHRRRPAFHAKGDALRDLPRLAGGGERDRFRSAATRCRAAIERIDLLGGPRLQFRRDAEALRLTLPPAAAGAFVPACGSWAGAWSQRTSR